VTPNADKSGQLQLFYANVLYGWPLRYNRDGHLYMHHDIVVHLDGHLVHIMVDVVVHHCIDEHEHHVTLELGRRTDHSAVDVLLDCRQVHRPEHHTTPSTS